MLSLNNNRPAHPHRQGRSFTIYQPKMNPCLLRVSHQRYVNIKIIVNHFIAQIFKEIF
jgi:hypothetical protein